MTIKIEMVLFMYVSNKGENGEWQTGYRFAGERYERKCEDLGKERFESNIKNLDVECSTPITNIYSGN